MNKPLILVLCTGNSCRSHIGEGLLRHLLGDRFEIASAGSHPAGFVHPLAIEVMKEIGIDISTHTSKHMDQFLARNVGTVITVCNDADKACPVFPGKVQRLHMPFEDPAKFNKIEKFREIRDQMKEVLSNYAKQL